MTASGGLYDSAPVLATLRLYRMVMNASSTT
jgi:hypothetical protein